MSRTLTQIILTLSLLLISVIAQAETRYVVDELVITLRTGQSTEYQIISTLPSGTKLELLETGDTYSRVRAPDGKEGWVLNQYISKNPTARMQLAEAQSRVSSLESENARLKSELENATSKGKQLDTAYQKLDTEHKSLTDELERLRRVSAQPLKLENENQGLKKDLLELENEYELLRQEHQLLTDSSDREWFLTGAGVIVLGILIGLIAPKLRTRKKSSW